MFSRFLRKVFLESEFLMPEKKYSKPNIILITTDQQRHDTVSKHGCEFLRTPHIDDLKRQGITFTRAYSECPLCVPARVSIMTGKSVLEHGMLANYKSSDVMGDNDTLPAMLRENGYQTAAIGKMHFTPERVRHGFEEMILPDDYYRLMARNNGLLQPMRHGIGQNELYPGMSTVPESMTLTSWIAERCVEYIKYRRDPSKPFFLWCSFSKPHPPFDPPEPYYSMYRNCNIKNPVYGNWAFDEKCPPTIKRYRQKWSSDLLNKEVAKEAKAAYYGLITQVDYNMGRLFAALSDEEMFEDALIIYASDHGEFLGDHGLQAKTLPYEGATHIPLILRMPQNRYGKRAGEENRSLVTPADVFTTLVECAGGKIPENIRSINLYNVGSHKTKGRDNFITEVSMDETELAQTPVEMLFILAAISDENIPAQTIAPKFTGRFNKGVDYVGDIEQFEKEFNQDLAVINYSIKEFGLPENLKLSVHSGSDKFSIYKPINKALKRFDAGLHIKTAGTTWLEEIAGLAAAGGEGLEIAKKIYEKAYQRFDELCKPYATVIDIDKSKLPTIDEVNSWTTQKFKDTVTHNHSCEDYNPNVRQLLHVGYKVAADLGGEYINALEKYEDTIAEHVTENIYKKHIKPVFGD
jgi:arylsulfatase A-like enzyme